MRTREFTKRGGFQPAPIFSLGIYFLWVKKRTIVGTSEPLYTFRVIFAAVTMSYYGGVAVGAGILEPSVIGIPFNIFIFASMFVIQASF